MLCHFRRGCLRCPGRTVNVLVFGVFVLLAASPATSQDEFLPVFRPEMQILRATGPIEVDGELGDPGWEGAARAGNFSEHNPGDQTKPEVDTFTWRGCVTTIRVTCVPHSANVMQYSPTTM
jgi:hypothetical protein